MSSNAALTLEGEDSLPIVKVRASAVFSILSNFVRRGEKQARVIGTLVGCVNEGNVVEVIINDCDVCPLLFREQRYVLSFATSSVSSSVTRPLFHVNQLAI